MRRWEGGRKGRKEKSCKGGWQTSWHPAIHSVATPQFRVITAAGICSGGPARGPGSAEKRRRLARLQEQTAHGSQGHGCQEEVGPALPRPPSHPSGGFPGPGANWTSRTALLQQKTKAARSAMKLRPSPAWHLIETERRRWQKRATLSPTAAAGHAGHLSLQKRRGKASGAPGGVATFAIWNHFGKGGR